MRLLWLAPAPLALLVPFRMNAASPCAEMTGSAIAFVARVLSEGSGRARVAVEEPLLNVPQDLHEIDVETLFSINCDYHLHTGERHVLFAKAEPGTEDKVSVRACSSSFNVQGNEHILDALRNKSNSGPPRLVGTVLRNTGLYAHDGVVAAATVIAESAAMRQEVMTDASGHYEIRGLAQGSYRLEVSKPGFLPDSAGANPGTVVLDAGSCEVRDLSMWPNGRISGTARSRQGELLSGVTMQAFGFDDGTAKRQPAPLREITTDGAGRYTLDRLPKGDYVVGVNAQMYEDVDDCPPTIYTTGRGDSTRVHVPDGEETKDVDLVLPPKRVPATLRIITVVKGSPSGGVRVTLSNLDGELRWDSNERTNGDGWIEASVYIGEEYVVDAEEFLDRLPHRGRQGPAGMARVRVTEEHQSVVVVLNLP